jgi:hypothetical protein
MDIAFKCTTEEDRQFLAAAETRGFGPTVIGELLGQVFEGLRAAVKAGLTYGDLRRFEGETRAAAVERLGLHKYVSIVRDQKGNAVGAEHFIPDNEPFWLATARTLKHLTPADMFIRRVNRARGVANRG